MTRHLINKEDKNTHNAWDNEELKGLKLIQAQKKIERDIEHSINNKIEIENQEIKWNNFYKIHSNFFKNRRYLIQYFPSILKGKRIFEFGVGAGNSLHFFFKLNEFKNKENHENDFFKFFEENDYLMYQGDGENNENKDTENKNNKNNFKNKDTENNFKNKEKDIKENNFKNKNKDIEYFKNIENLEYIKSFDFLNEILPYDIHGCDISEKAVQMCQKKYFGNFFVHDITKDFKLTEKLSNFDTILLIYTLSAIDPKYHKNILKKSFSMLKKGGKLFFKDYGNLDMVQLRYKKENIIDNNFYKRNDGTLTYFFTKEYFLDLVSEFKIIKLEYKKKMLVNRKRNLDMYRVFLEGVLEKP